MKPTNNKPPEKEVFFCFAISLFFCYTWNDLIRSFLVLVILWWDHHFFKVGFVADIFQAEYDTPIAGISSTMSLLKRADLSLDVGYHKSFFGELKGLFVFCSSADSSPTTLTIRLCSDSQGDHIIIPDSSASLSFGLSTATKAGASWAINIPFMMSTETLYLFAKTDTGTITIDSIWLSWERCR